MSIKKEDIARVKGMGFLLNRGTEKFSGRVVAPGSVFTAGQVKALAECAERFGNGTVAFTVRLCAEIVGIPYENIEPARAFLQQAGLEFGGTGAKVRPVVACKGTTCVYGNYDTQALARHLHEKYYLGWKGVSLPHKFKIAVGGCPNSCAKPSLNDFGIEGHRVPVYDSEKCRGCKVCSVQASCPVKAVSMENGKAKINTGACISCGVCVGKCPFGAVAPESETVYAIYVGGTWGKTTRNGTRLSRMVRADEIDALIEKTMLWFRENAYQKERLGKAIDRLGVDALEQALFGGDLLARKEEILAAPIRTAP
ncbi:MAG TPA: 4Fe-4S binding protein [Candidatus Alectryocaccomicrobium excrementavium]|uniref:4Fe-4S binding protein n=1 Tax=Candidatus Alectryocaccomicrobium excrementavium TaxID=2840668 RepID=A0A9D1K4Y9_9FIRM|nr:4Fe-4S binding protein [Candidatus Alectryocaccomicrobium excrementavium]